MNTITLGIHGAAGRLGRRILALGLDDARFTVGAAVVRDGGAAQGKDAGVLAGMAPIGLLARSDLATLLHCDVVIDVSNPPAGAALATLLAAQGGKHLVTGTTGWNDKEEQALSAAARCIALLRSGNFSLGVAALCQTVRETAARLGAQWGVHIHDHHHSAKKDAPSGTSLMLVRAVCEGWGKTVTPLTLSTGARLQGAPQPAKIIISVDRAGDVIGMHDVYFVGPGETLRLGHEAQSRDIFAYGALQAAHWLASKPVGFYGMNDVLTPGAD